MLWGKQDVKAKTNLLPILWGKVIVTGLLSGITGLL
jgi:hypothetical protein